MAETPQAQGGSVAPGERRAVRVPIVQSADYRTVVAEGAVIASRADNVGTTISVHITRFDTVPSAERFDTTVGGAGITQVGPPGYDLPEPRKILEVSLVLRPDHAFNLAVAILNNLAGMPEDSRKRYHIPKFTMAQGKGPTEG